MEASHDSHAASSAATEDDVVATILGYLNFSNGTPDVSVQRAFNGWWNDLGAIGTWPQLRDRLLDELGELRKSSAAFTDSQQAETVIGLVFDDCLPAYRAHHSELLFHLTDEEFQQPLFVARVCEAVLAQGPVWNDRDRIVAGALDQLNDFLGYRPLALLENGRHSQPYAHERFRPIPLYIRGVGASVGKYQALIERTIQFFRDTPDEILHEAHFDLSQLDELAIDVRAHDHAHPMNKRTNYMFGEWDPHQIDNKGNYRRFVVRRIILDMLVQWIDECEDAPPEELLYDATAALCGTILMASSVSGSGPGTHDSTVTLTSLLPKIARQRDAFYARLLAEATGKRATRLRREAKLTQQPFGHVRQRLNIHLAQYGSRQVQYQHLTELFARMGFPEESRRQAAKASASSTRFECEMGWRITSAHLDIDRGQLQNVSEKIVEIEDLLERGIECGAIVDPWNILGFQELFPLFHSREDSIADQRVEKLLHLMERIFGLYSRVLGEAAAQGDEELCDNLSQKFQRLAEKWDRYASIVVTSLPHVSGQESYDSARQVSRALTEWRNAGEAAGDISFWRGKVDQFQSAKAYALVVEALLQKDDHVAAMGLLMQWLSQGEEVGLESGPHSLFPLLVRWMRLVCDSDGRHLPADEVWPAIRKLFDYLEANAGDFWLAPNLSAATGTATAPVEEEAGIDPASEFDDDEDHLFDAAYDNVVYRDTANDGQQGDTMDDGVGIDDTEFSRVIRFFEPRLKFLNTVAQLWQMAAASLLSQLQVKRPKKDGSFEVGGEQVETILSWVGHVEHLEKELQKQIVAIWRHDIPIPEDQINGDGEYGFQLQEKFDLLQTMIATSISCQNARRCLLCCVPDIAVNETLLAKGERPIIQLFRALFRRDAAETRRLLPKIRRQLTRQPLLYVPLENGGNPEDVRAARFLLSNFRFLLSQLPQVGLLKETWDLLQTAYRMERSSRPTGGTAVTEFDRLFRTALHSSLECVIESSRGGKEDIFSSDQIIEFVGEIVERYLPLWLKHSAATRLSSVEKLDEESIWLDVKDFIAEYGADLFNAQMLLPPGKIRAILHHGVDQFLDELTEFQDPLHPLQLIEDLENDAVDREFVVESLELIYEALMDGLDHFLEYKTTTTQSDYGEMIYCLLDFMRVEAAYERDAWNLAPVGIAHELLAGPEKTEAAMIWESLFAEKTGDKAERHLSQLQALEKTHGMRLPSISDRLNERFIKPLAVNRMLALVAPAMKDACEGKLPSTSFDMLRDEIEDYVQTTSGSGYDIPDWMRNLKQAVDREDRYMGGAIYQSETEFRLPRILLNRRQIQQQLKTWDEQPGKKKPKAKRKPKGKRSGGSKT